MSKKKKKSSADPKKLTKIVLDYFYQHPNKSFNPKQIATGLSLTTKKERQQLEEVLEVLAAEGTLQEPERFSYSMDVKAAVVEGVVDMTKSGSAYIVTDAFENDVYVPQHKVNGALDKDKVRVRVDNPRRKLHGEIEEVLERHKTVFSGIVQVSEKFAFLIPDSRKMKADIFIPLRDLNGAENGQKALAEMVEWPRKAKSPVGQIVSVLGQPGEHQTEMNAIIAEFDLPVTFPPEVEAEAEAIEEAIPEKEIEAREDLRGIPTFTIDPVDARDFDDALSIRSLGGGWWEVGIHIADVSHYVRPDTELDKEAIRRATSVYLVDRVIPMLPEKLSNELCSLRPDEDKLAFSAIFEMNTRGSIRAERFGRTLIRSQQRFSYEDAQEVLDGKRHKLGKYLRKLNQLAYKLREAKFAAGAISFESTEVVFELDAHGKPLGVVPKVRADAHKLIEDFMLLANKRVAAYNKTQSVEEARKRSFVYRVHAAPDQEKLSQLASIAHRFGYRIDLSDPGNLSKQINKLLSEVEGKPEQAMLQTMSIRTMSKAHYTTQNIGHYGLAFEDYTHFTSPIRRYPDILAHRLLDDHLRQRPVIPAEKLEPTLKHCSQMEINAEEAERASIKYKQVEYMQQFVGDEFEGLVSGVTDWGIFIEIIQNKCEGLVRLSEMIDDYYFLDDENYQVVGYNSRKVFRLGDKVLIRVLSANLQQRTLDFDMVRKLSTDEGAAPLRPIEEKPKAPNASAGGNKANGKDGSRKKRR